MISSWCHEEFASLLVLENCVSVFSERLIKFHLLPCENSGEVARSCGIAAGCAVLMVNAQSLTYAHQLILLLKELRSKRGVQNFRSLRVELLLT